MAYFVLTEVAGQNIFEEKETLRSTGQRTFRAAVYEHPVILPSNRETPTSRSVALSNMMKNLEIYRQQTEVASKEVNITVVSRG